jgi:hypothetical protein
MLRYAIRRDNQKAGRNEEFGLDGVGRFCKNPPAFLGWARNRRARSDWLALEQRTASQIEIQLDFIRRQILCAWRHAMGSNLGRWQRKLLAIGAALVVVTPLAVWADGWGLAPAGAQNQSVSSAPAKASVQKDDSNLTVVEADRPQDEPMVDVANKKKKSPSFWTKLWHPTQWFSTSKKK